ncbi:histidine kinase dimerization/phosphoacceptor domain -containing protein, partial [Rhizobium ruizarguesonis]
STMVFDQTSMITVFSGSATSEKAPIYSSAEVTAAAESFGELLTEKDVLLRELQNRVKNNLQMITALIRMEASNAQQNEESERFA